MNNSGNDGMNSNQYNNLQNNLNGVNSNTDVQNNVVNVNNGQSFENMTDQTTQNVNSNSNNIDMQSSQNNNFEQNMQTVNNKDTERITGQTQQNVNGNQYNAGTTDNQSSNAEHNKQPSNNKFNFKDKKFIILIVIVVLVVVVVLFLTLFNKDKAKNNGYTADSGELLEINEKYEMFNIRTTSSIERHTTSGSFIFDGDYIKLGVYVENPTTSDLSFSNVDFYLTDSDKNTLYYTSFLYTDDDSIFGKTIASGNSDEGYIYFYTGLSEDSIGYTTDYSKMDEVEYLRISVISEMDQSSGGVINYDREDYYLKID